MSILYNNFGEINKRATYLPVAKMNVPVRKEKGKTECVGFFFHLGDSNSRTGTLYKKNYYWVSIVIIGNKVCSKFLQKKMFKPE